MIEMKLPTMSYSDSVRPGYNNAGPTMRQVLAQRLSVTLEVAPAIRPGDPIPLTICCLEAVEETTTTTGSVGARQTTGCTGTVAVSVDGTQIASQTVDVPATECVTLEAPTDGIALGDHVVEVSVDGVIVTSAEIRIVDLPNVNLPGEARGPLANIPPEAAVGAAILTLLFL